MNPLELIIKKRDSQTLTADEIHSLIQDYANDLIPDYQMAAWAMAVVCRGMSFTETVALTAAMRDSGEILSWPSDTRPVLDKHSTGGVGDKTSLVLVPLLASLGVRIPKLSGRGLGSTGGTLDKLESIKGFRVDLDVTELQTQVDQIGCAIVSTNQRLAPADKRLYALRDVTGTVASIPLITSSILSKKLAEGIDGVVFDVKHGCGAFMQSLDDAQSLAQSMVAVAAELGTPAAAVLSAMDQPLGCQIGNAGEVNEAVEVLCGKGPADVRELVLTLGQQLLSAANPSRDREQLEHDLHEALASGRAMETFERMVRAQGGTWDGPLPLHQSTELTCQQQGWITAIDSRTLGQCVVDLGGGRQRLGDSIDPQVGLQLLLKTGAAVQPGTAWCRVFHRNTLPDSIQQRLSAALQLSQEPPDITTPIISGVITPSDLPQAFG